MAGVGEQSASGYPEEVGAFVESFAGEMVESGLPRMASRIFAYLLASDAGAATAAELATRLRASPAAISGAVRYLIQVRLVQRQRRPGERKDTYLLASDLWYEALGTRDEELRRWGEKTAAGVAAVGPHTPAGRRLEETARFFEFLRLELRDVMERWKAERNG